MSTQPLLSVRGLAIEVDAPAGRATWPGVRDVSFDIGVGRVVALVGSSASGKTLTALSLLRLLPPAARIISGEVRFDGQDLLALSEGAMEAIRGRRIAMVFQEPASALSPMHDVGWHLRTVLQATGQLTGSFRERRRQAMGKSRELLAQVELPDPAALLEAHPHQLSAGMRRRVLLAMALAGQPRLLIADEPTTGLDAPIQAQLLDLLARMTRDGGSSMLVISHDPEVAAELAQDVLIMSSGRIVESGPLRRVFSEAQHPYTARLLASVRARRASSGAAPLASGTTARGSTQREPSPSVERAHD